MLFERVSKTTANYQTPILHWFYFKLCEPTSTNGGLVTGLQTPVSPTQRAQRGFLKDVRVVNMIGAV